MTAAEKELYLSDLLKKYNIDLFTLESSLIDFENRII
jgi:hypothetical protein